MPDNRVTEQFWSDADNNLFEQRTIESGRIKAVEKMVELAAPFVNQPNSTTVDLGCGTGLFAKLSGNSNIVGVDFSSELLETASTRMEKIVEASIFEFKKPDNSLDNIISMFVLDDYPNDTKLSFFESVFKMLKPGGHFFFAAYSRNDERMGRRKEEINALLGSSFNIYLEDLAYFTTNLKSSAFEIIDSSVVNSEGIYNYKKDSITVVREFYLIVAMKPDAPAT